MHYNADSTAGRGVEKKAESDFTKQQCMARRVVFLRAKVAGILRVREKKGHGLAGREGVQSCLQMKGNDRGNCVHRYNDLITACTRERGGF